MTKVELNTSKELLQSSLLSPPPARHPCGLRVSVCLPEKMTKLWVCKGNTAGRLWFQLSEAAPRASPPAVIQRVPRLENVLEVRKSLETIPWCKLSPLSNPTINLTLSLSSPFPTVLPASHSLQSPAPRTATLKPCRTDWMASVYSSVL